MGDIKSVYVKSHDLTTESVSLDRVMTPRKRNRAHERTMGFLNKNQHWVNATVLVDLDGNPVDMAGISLKLDIVVEQLIEMNERLNNAV